MQDQVNQGQRPLYSPPRYASDFEGSEGSFDEEMDPEEFEAEYNLFPRTTSQEPVPTVGFRDSVYGPHPSNVIVARTGPRAGHPLVYRTDNEPTYRFEGRPPGEIRADEGYRPINDRLPVSLQSYQNTTQRTGFVSFTRNPNPSADMLQRVDELSRVWNPDRGPNEPVYRYKNTAPGGYDVTASLGPQSYADQHEVVFYGGVRDRWTTEITPFTRNAEGDWVEGETEPYVPAQSQGQPENSRSNVAWAANLDPRAHHESSSGKRGKSSSSSSQGSGSRASSQESQGRSHGGGKKRR
ncbi:scabin-related ADP-ribosyltransferase [Streptomyces fumanus]|uniref:scabin-related ADP-ribosyltransferase n=1 Tax=Streptomyces fumanus TaxID=67302 RepID=UPI0034100B03